AITQGAAAGQSPNTEGQIGAALALTGMRWFQESDQQADLMATLHHSLVIRQRVGSGLVTGGWTFQAQATAQIPFVPVPQVTGQQKNDVNVDFQNEVVTALDLGGTGTTFATVILPD